MTVINTNVGALQARTYAVRADSSVTKAMERLSSGLRINSAADDAAGLAVANKMESQIRGMNMAIRNSQDGISLVQTAEAAMGEINNMVIRMRELAVQMNNGVYTDADRANAQLEVNALLAEIDKVANNSAFNQVKILDGTYSQDIRAGNTNPEVINVTIDRMNTDSLGGGRVTTGEVDAAAVSNTFKTSNTTITAEEGRVTFGTSSMGAIATHAADNTGGTWSIAENANDDSGLFTIDAASGAVTLNSTQRAELDFDTSNADNNTYSFAIEYTQGGTTVTDNITLNIEDRAPVTSTTTGSAALTVEEGDCVKIYSVDTTDNGTDYDGVFSDQFKEFVGANAGNVTFSVSGNDAAQVTLNSATGALLANLDFERPTDAGGNNVYEFDVVATVGTVTVTESVTLTVTDDHADQVVLTSGVNHTDVAASAGADGAALESTSNTYTAADTVALSGTLNVTADGSSTAASLTWAELDSLIAVGGGSDGITEFITDAGGNTGLTVAVSNAGSSTITATTGNVGISLTNAVADADDVAITLTNTSTGQKFVIDLDVVAASGATATNTTIIAENEEGIAEVRSTTNLNFGSDLSSTSTIRISDGTTIWSTTGDISGSTAAQIAANLNAVVAADTTNGDFTIAESGGQLTVTYNAAGAQSETLTISQNHPAAVAEVQTSSGMALASAETANDVYSLTVGSTTITTGATSSVGDYDTITKLATALNNAATTASASFGVGVNAGGTELVITYGTAQAQADENISLSFTAGTSGATFTAPTFSVTTQGSDQGTSADFNAGTWAVDTTGQGAPGQDGLARSGASSTLDALAGGEELRIDLKVASSGQNATTNDTFFNTIGDAYDADPCGTFEIVSGSLAFDGATTGTTKDNLDVSADGILTLAAGAERGTYSALVKYTNNDGDATYERVELNTLDIGEASGIDVASATALTASTGSRASTRQIEGTSVLSMAEGRQGNIISTGTDHVLSDAFDDFVDFYQGGSYSISGVDQSSFTIDEETGAIETNGLVDYETKSSYSITVTYTSGNNSYSEDVTLNVTNNPDDDTTHINDVDLGTQAGSAAAVTILDTAINQISSSQAKLGAIQNRLQYNIDNLSKATMLTQTAKGRIMDADFAAETSELSKQQILSQAATSMLAQANQSKQSVLALLQ